MPQPDRLGSLSSPPLLPPTQAGFLKNHEAAKFGSGAGDGAALLLAKFRRGWQGEAGGPYRATVARLDVSLWASSGSPSPQSTIMHGGCKSRGRTAGPGLPAARPLVENAARAGPGRCGLPSRARWLANENSARRDDESVPAQAHLRPTMSQAGASVRAVHRQRGWLLRACVTHQVAQSAPRPCSPTRARQTRKGPRRRCGPRCPLVALTLVCAPGRPAASEPLIPAHRGYSSGPDGRPGGPAAASAVESPKPSDQSSWPSRPACTTMATTFT